EVAGGHADERADQGHGDADEKASAERVARAPDGLRENILAGAGRAEPELGRWRLVRPRDELIGIVGRDPRGEDADEDEEEQDAGADRRLAIDEDQPEKRGAGYAPASSLTGDRLLSVAGAFAWLDGGEVAGHTGILPIRCRERAGRDGR